MIKFTSSILLILNSVQATSAAISGSLLSKVSDPIRVLDKECFTNMYEVEEPDFGTTCDTDDSTYRLNEGKHACQTKCPAKYSPFNDDGKEDDAGAPVEDGQHQFCL